jgi:PAS domain S-box-containing protein
MFQFIKNLFVRQTIISDDEPNIEQATLVELTKMCADMAQNLMTENHVLNALRRQIAEDSPDATVISNEAGQIVLVNRRVELMFGYERGELLGKMVEVLLPYSLRSSHAEHRTNYEKYPTVREMGVRPPLACKRKNGQEFKARISIGPTVHPEGIFYIVTLRRVD